MSKRSNKNRQKNNLIVLPDPYYDLIGFDFSLWKICVFLFGMICAIPCFIFMLSVKLKTLVVIASFLCMSVFVFINIISNIKKRRLLNESFFILLAAILCIILTENFSALLIIFIYSVIKLLEVYFYDSQKTKTGAILDLIPSQVVAIDGENATTKKPSRIKAGDYIGVNAGEVIPVDGIVIEGNSTADYSKLVNSDFTIKLDKGSRVISGGINSDDAIIVKCTNDYNDCFLLKLYDVYSKAFEFDTSEMIFFRNVYKYWILLFSALIIIFGAILPVFKGFNTNYLKKCVYLCFAACPYSMISIIQYSSCVALEKLYSFGIYIRKASDISVLSKIRTIIFNKTQTLTENDFIIEDVVPVGLNITNFLSLVNTVESISCHPIANSLRTYCGISDFEVPDTLKAQELSGKGIVATIGKTSVVVGNASLLSDYSVNFSPVERNGNVVYVAVNYKYCGYIVFSNKLREDSFDAMESIKNHNIQNLVMLSGDMQSVTRPIANALGFNVQKTEASLSDKAKVVDYLINNRDGQNYIGYVGNSIFEYNASSHADISIATDMFSYIDYFNLSNVNILSSGITGVANALNCAAVYALTVRILIISALVSKLFSFIVIFTGFPEFWIAFLICIVVSYTPLFIVKFLYRRL